MSHTWLAFPRQTTDRGPHNDVFSRTRVSLLCESIMSTADIACRFLVVETEHRCAELMIETERDVAMR